MTKKNLENTVPQSISKTEQLEQEVRALREQLAQASLSLAEVAEFYRPTYEMMGLSTGCLDDAADYTSLSCSVSTAFVGRDEVDIYEPLDPEQQLRADAQAQERTMILNHAYGFASRGNVAGALKHLYSELDKDPDSATGWPWYFDKMLQWDDAGAALVFAQQYLKRLLHAEENIAAMKLISRCRLINESFRPLPEDRDLAFEAARACHNEELIQFLR